jgi:hypothetical protein
MEGGFPAPPLDSADAFRWSMLEDDLVAVT